LGRWGSPVCRLIAAGSGWSSAARAQQFTK
jgi:hypothetical protein